MNWLIDFFTKKYMGSLYVVNAVKWFIDNVDGLKVYIAAAGLSLTQLIAVLNDIQTMINAHGGTLQVSDLIALSHNADVTAFFGGIIVLFGRHTAQKLIDSNNAAAAAQTTPPAQQ